MANSSFINKIFGFSPHFEMIARRINYYLPFKLTDKTKNKVVNKTENADFEQVIGFLKACGVQQDSLLIVHSAYGNLKGTQLSPQGIIDKLQVLVGTKGTLAMPVIRNYKTYSNAKEYVNDSIDDAVMVYDTQHSAIWTGAIAKQFAKNPNVAISRFPLNTLAAIGPLAAPMMEHNLEGDLPTAIPPGNFAWTTVLIL
jgi:aminoglycoside N3'-acetyltransferase